MWMTGLARSAFNIRKPFAKVGRFEGGAFGIVKSRPHSTLGSIALELQTGGRMSCVSS